MSKAKYLKSPLLGKGAIKMKRLFKRIELAFWDAIIPLLSESQFVRGSLKEVHDLYTGKNNWFLYLVISWAAVALIIGFILGHTRILFW
jgi:hypothetical protein